MEMIEGTVGKPPIGLDESSTETISTSFNFIDTKQLIIIDVSSRRLHRITFIVCSMWRHLRR